jgi:ankyrin repeat protein
MSDDEQQFSRALKLRLINDLAKHGDAAALKRLLVPGDQKNDWNGNELRIALQKASEVGNQAAVRLLLESGAKTDVITRNCLTPLHRAAMNGHYTVVKDLLEHGANIEAKDVFGRSSTWYAASRGRNEVLRLLLQEGANVNAVDKGGKSVLYNLAANTERQRRWDHVIISSLLYFNPDLGLIDKTGRTMLHWAAVTGNVEFAKLLLLPPSRAIVLVSATTHRGKTALQLAAERGHNAMVFLLLQYGADANAKSDGDWTPLLNAAKEGHKDVVDTLLRFSNPNSRTSSGRTALHWAADQGHLGVVRRILVEPTSLTNSKDNSKNTPFSLAAQKGHHEIMEILKPYTHDHGPSDHAKHACENFTAAVVDFVRDPEEKKASPKVQRLSVYDVLYSPKRKPKLPKGEPVAPSNETTNNRFLITTNLKIVKADFRWIHLPANNVAWAEALINKYFIEHGDRAIYESMLQSLQDQQHRGPQAHSFYMRPIFEEVWRDAFPLPAQKRAKSEGMGHSWVSAAGKIDHSTASPQMASESPKNVFVLFVS